MGNIKRAHQNIEIDGVDWGKRQSRKRSKFCNEGKWENFVKPFLPNGGYFFIAAPGIGFPKHDYPEDYWRFNKEVITDS